MQSKEERFIQAEIERVDYLAARLDAAFCRGDVDLRECRKATRKWLAECKKYTALLGEIAKCHNVRKSSKPCKRGKVSRPSTR